MDNEDPPNIERGTILARCSGNSRTDELTNGNGCRRRPNNDGRPLFQWKANSVECSHYLFSISIMYRKFYGHIQDYERSVSEWVHDTLWSNNTGSVQFWRCFEYNVGHMAIPIADCNREIMGDRKSGYVPSVRLFGAGLFLCLVVQLFAELLLPVDSTLPGVAKEFRRKMWTMATSFGIILSYHCYYGPHSRVVWRDIMLVYRPKYYLGLCSNSSLFYISVPNY